MRRDVGLAAGLALLAVGVRALVGLRESVLFNTGPRILEQAGAFLGGDVATALGDEFHPLTALLIAAASGSTGLGPETAGRAISVAAGGVAAAALFLLARDLFDRRVGVATALLFAFHPRMVELSCNVQTDGLHLALFLVAALAGWRALEAGRAALAFASGLVCGLAYLVRPEGLAVGVVLGAALLVDVATRRRSPWRTLALAGAFAWGLGLLMGPYVATMHAQSGEWRLTRKKSAVHMTQAAVGIADPASPAPGPSPPAPPRGARPAPSGAQTPEAPRLLHALRDVSLDWVRAIHLVPLPLLLVGLAGRRPDRGALFLLSFSALFWPLLFGLYMSAGYVSPRHWICPVALLLPFSALGLFRVAAWRAPAEPSGPARRRLAVVTAVAIAGMAVQLGLSGPPSYKRARHQAALWLHERHRSQVVAAPRERNAFLAGASRFVSLPETLDGQALVDAVRQEGAQFLLVEQSRLGTPRPEALAGAREVHRVEYGDGAVLVLELEDSGGEGRAPRGARPSRVPR